MLLLVIGLTILRIRQLISVHLFVGLLLIGPVALKMASTGYRFMRYYSGNRVYRRKGSAGDVAAVARADRRADDGDRVRHRRAC